MRIDGQAAGPAEVDRAEEPWLQAARRPGLSAREKKACELMARIQSILLYSELSLRALPPGRSGAR